MFIDVLEKELKDRNLTLNKLAKGAGIAQSPTSRWKNGSLPSVDVLKKICEYLNVSADYLLELKPPENNISKEEKWLLRYYKAADDRGKEFILEIAEREAERAENKEKSLTSKIG